MHHHITTKKYLTYSFKLLTTKYPIHVLPYLFGLKLSLKSRKEKCIMYIKFAPKYAVSKIKSKVCIYVYVFI